MQSDISLMEVKDAPAFSMAKSLILEYTSWLGFDLSFQQFDDEINNLSAIYTPPAGCLFLAMVQQQAVGVAGIKQFDDDTAEVKRMFVQEASRNKGLGKLLLDACIAKAGEFGYKFLNLDTADFMDAAIHLYTSRGFGVIPAYRFNPHAHARYFQLALHAK